VEGMITDGDRVILSMEMTQAHDLRVFMASESSRRREEFEISQIMACWSCLNACETLGDALEELGFTDTDMHSQSSEGGYGKSH